MAELPFITVVMPVRNEERHIRETLLQVLRQDYPAERFEVIVADGMSDDRTPEIVAGLAKEFPNLREVKNPARRSSAGRNAGFREGKGELFLVIDGHCHIGSGSLLRSVAKCFEKSGAQCLGRPQPLDPPGLSGFQKSVALARASKLAHSSESLIYGEFEGYASPVSNGAAYRKEVFSKVGYLDESFDACEDVEFNYRVEKAGLKAYTSPSLTVRYYPRETLSSLFSQMARYGRGRRKFVRKHPAAFTAELLVPPFFVAGIFVMALAWAGALLSGAFAVPAALLSALYLLYVLIVSAESLRIAFRNGFAHLKYLPFIIFTVHAGLGWGFIREAFAGGEG